MPEQRVLEVQQGVWIEEAWLQQAGLATPLQIVIESGVIRICSAADEAKHVSSPVSGWDVFRSLGEDASPGQLANAAIAHDQYLYGKTS